MSAVRPQSLLNTPKHIILPPNQASFRMHHSEVPSFRKAEVCSSAFLVTHSAPSIPHECLLGLSDLCIAPSALPPASPGRLFSTLLFLTPDHMASSLHTRPRGGPSYTLSVHPHLNSQSGTSYVTSYPAPPMVR